MTEKRFTVDYRENTRLYRVEDNLHILDSGGFAIEYNAKKCCEELNTLHEENEQLKQINRNLGDFRNFITEQNVSNEKQRKELQLQMLRLYNYFENWFEDAMSPNEFSEMWDNVKEDKKWEKR